MSKIHDKDMRIILKNYSTRLSIAFLPNQAEIVNQQIRKEEPQTYYFDNDFDWILYVDEVGTNWIIPNLKELPSIFEGLGYNFGGPAFNYDENFGSEEAANLHPRPLSSETIDTTPNVLKAEWEQHTRNCATNMSSSIQKGIALERVQTIATNISTMSQVISMSLPLDKDIPFIDPQNEKKIVKPVINESNINSVSTQASLVGTFGISDGIVFFVHPLLDRDGNIEYKTYFSTFVDNVIYDLLVSGYQYNDNFPIPFTAGYMPEDPQLEALRSGEKVDPQHLMLFTRFPLDLAKADKMNVDELKALIETHQQNIAETYNM